MDNVCSLCDLHQVLDNTLHPGGLKLTERLATIAMFNSNSKILEIGCGRGITTIFLVKHYGCSIVGIDRSTAQLTLANDLANNENLSTKTSFITADAQCLPFYSEIFDAVISECSISLVPDKKCVVDEIWRVLKPGGKLTISDLINIDDEVENGFGAAVHSSNNFHTLFPCINNTESIEGYMRLLKGAGFQELYTEDCSIALKEAYFRMLLRFGRMDKLSMEIACSCSEDHDMMPAKKFIKKSRRNTVGYALISATKE